MLLFIRFSSSFNRIILRVAYRRVKCFFLRRGISSSDQARNIFFRARFNKNLEKIKKIVNKEIEISSKLIGARRKRRHSRDRTALIDEMLFLMSDSFASLPSRFFDSIIQKNNFLMYRGKFIFRLSPTLIKFDFRR